MSQALERAAAEAGISLDQARAFLGALRAPSVEMEAAAGPIVDQAWDAGLRRPVEASAERSVPAVMVVPANPREIWQSMIDAVLAD